MDTYPVPPKKKGCGPLAWLGMGCGALIAIFVLIGVGVGVFFGPQLKQFGQDYQKDPTRTTAYAMVGMGGASLKAGSPFSSTSVSLSPFEMVKEDQANKRYTLRQKKTGQLATIYWDARQGKVATVQGDFSAIPADANPSQGQPTPR